MPFNRGTVLLTIRGTLLPKTIDAARQVHNETAGNDQGVAAARALGDLSHSVWVPSSASPSGAATELFIQDIWNNPDGLQKFFADPHVQEGGGRIFASKDPVVWLPADDFESFALPVPSARRDRFLGIVRGTVRSREAAREAFNGITTSTLNAARMLGQVSHEIFFRAGPPGSPEALELIGVDVWYDAGGMGQYYAEPKHLAPLRDVFTARPDTSIWQQPAGAWVEW